MKSSWYLRVAAILALVWAPIETTAAQGARHQEELEKYYRPNSCGPVSLFVVCCAFGIDATIAELSELSGLDANGTTFAGLVKAAESKGLKAAASKCNLQYLKRIEGPAVIDCGQGHFCVLFRWKDGKALIVDPPAKNQWVAHEQLQANWGGHVIEFSVAKPSE